MGRQRFAPERAPLLAAYNMVRRISSTYTGPLYQVRSGSSAQNTGVGGGLHDVVLSATWAPPCVRSAAAGGRTPSQTAVGNLQDAGPVSRFDVGMSNHIVVVRSFPWPVERVFSAWTSPASVVAPVVAVAMDPVRGGAIRISTGGSESEDLRGTFIEVVPNQRLRYTWRWGTDVEETIVTVTFHAVGSNTVVELEHAGFTSTETQARHLSGWVSYLDGLLGLL